MKREARIAEQSNMEDMIILFRLFARHVSGATAALACALLALGQFVMTGSASAAVQQQEMKLPAADGRTVVVQVYAPADGCQKCTLILFSHGNLATPQRYDILLRAWAERGFVVAAPLHTDSEEYPDRARYPDSRSTRLEDWRIVDRAMRGSPIKGISLSGKVIAAGHSYGGIIAEIVGGARPNEKADVRRDWRIPVAVVALSPPGVMPYMPMEGYAMIHRPTLVVTGTTDVLPGFIDQWQQHLASYEAMKPGLGYALVFDGMNHYFNGAFGRPLPTGVQSAHQVAQLNELVIDFIGKALRNRLPTPEQWKAIKAAGVEARAK